MAESNFIVWNTLSDYRYIKIRSFFNNKLIRLCLIIKECYISLVNKNYYFENSDSLEKFKQELKYLCEAVCNIHVVVAMCDDR